MVQAKEQELSEPLETLRGQEITVTLRTTPTSAEHGTLRGVHGEFIRLERRENDELLIPIGAILHIAKGRTARRS